MSAQDAVARITTVEALLAHALAIESEAAERYGELADQMEVHNNHEVAALFRRLEVIEGRHVDSVAGLGEGRALPHISPWEYAWEAASPEAPEDEAMHYLMTPHHALSAALAAERRAAAFFGRVAAVAADAEVRRLAERLQAEECEHVELMREWLERYPEPEAGWDDDPDPPAAHE